MAAAIQYTSSVIVEELTADPSGATVGIPGRVLTLVGPAQPLAGAKWGGGSNMTTTWYPGNRSDATQQFLVPTEAPSQWHGVWDRMLLGREPSSFSGARLVEPMDLWDALESLCRSGLLLRVSWVVADAAATGASELRRVVRIGRAKAWDFTPRTLYDVEWEVTFEWKGRGVPQQKVSQATTTSTASVSQDLQNKINALLAAAAAAQAAKNAPKPLTLGQLEQIANTPTKLATQLARQVQQIGSTVGQVVALAKTIQSQPLQVINTLVDQAHSAVTQLNNFQQDLSQVPYERRVTRLKVESLLRAASAFGKQADAAQAAASSAQALATKIQPTLMAANALRGASNPRKTSAPEAVLRLYTVRAGDTPPRLSSRFYGTPDHALDILRANRLSWYTSALTPGSILVIPALNGDSALARGA